MSKNIMFMASLHSVKVDKEGESKVTLTIPKSDLDSAVQLAKQNEKFLAVGVVVYEEKPDSNNQDDIKRKLNF